MLKKINIFYDFFYSTKKMEKVGASWIEGLLSTGPTPSSLKKYGIYYVSSEKSSIGS
jgi:hypothetical protein